MKKLEILAYSVDEAKRKAAELGIKVHSNITRTWKDKGCPLSDNGLKELVIEKLMEKGISDFKGVGMIIAVDAGSRDTRERPYTLVNNVIKGSRETKRIVEIRLKSTNELIAEADNKGEAMHLAKELMCDYREDMIATVVYKVVGDKDVAFELKYTPSARAKQGKYIVVGTIPDKF